MRYVMLLVGMVGCGVEETEPPATDTATEALEPMRLTGITWLAPDAFGWQSPTWCAESYQVDWSGLATDIDVVCAQTLRLNDDGSVDWTVHVDRISEPADPADPMSDDPRLVDVRDGLDSWQGAWADEGPAYGADQELTVDGRMWIMQYENDEGAVRHTYAWASWFVLEPL